MYGLPTLRDFRPAGAPAPQSMSALCGAGAPAGEKTTDDDSPRIGNFAGGSVNNARLTCERQKGTLYALVVDLQGRFDSRVMEVGDEGD